MTKNKKEDYVVLSELEKTLLTLLYKSDLYGIQFVNAILEASDGKREVKFGSLYPTLTRMEKKGFVSWYWGDEQTGPRRKYYAITPYGRSLMEEDLRFREKLRALTVNAHSESVDSDSDPEPVKSVLNPLTKKR